MSLYHGLLEITSRFAKKSMIFTGYCQKRAAQISLLNENFEKAWLSAFIFKLSFAAYASSALSNSKFQLTFIT